jgi:hypothetical protein
LPCTTISPMAAKIKEYMRFSLKGLPKAKEKVKKKS